MLFLGGPLLDDPVWSTAAGWVNREAIESAKTGVRRNAGSGRTSREHGRLAADVQRLTSPGSWQVVPEGPQGQPCFRFSTKNLTGWDGYLSPDIPQLFADSMHC